MISVSAEYKNFLATTDALTPRFKIKVGDVEYLGDVIMSSPKISHSNTSFIGGFPSKTCSFELYNPNNEINLENKELEVFKGLVVNGVVEWVKQGVFIPQAKDITNDITTRKYKVSNASDKRQLLDVLYVSGLDWSTTHTGLEIVKDALKDTGVTLENETFGWASYSFEQPNFPSNATKTEVISRIAEIGGEIAIFNSKGNLVIKDQTATGDTIARNRYTNLTKENEYVVNTLVLGKEGASDDFVYKNEGMINKSTTKNLVDLTKIISTQNSPLITINNIERNALNVTVNPNITVWAKVAFPINDLLENGGLYTIALEVDENSDVLPNGRYGTFGLNRMLKTNPSQGQGDKSEVTLANTSDTFTRTTAWVIDKDKYDYYLDFFPAQGETITTSLNLIYRNIYLAKETQFSGYVDYKETGIKECKLLDNPYVDLNRAAMIELVAPYIIGKSYTPFELTNFVDGFIYELNDTLSVVDKNGETFTAVILEYNNSSRTRSSVKAQTSNSITNYKIAGSVKEQVANVVFEVNHIKNQITSIVSKGFVDENDLEVLRQSLVTQNEESITMTFNTLTEIMNNANAETQKQFQEQSKYIRFDGGITLGEVDNEVTLRVENDTIHFNVSNVKIMEITPNGINIEKVITKEIDMGDFSLIIEEDGSLSLV